MAAYAKVEGSYIDTLGSIEAITGLGVAHSFVESNAARFGILQDRIKALGIRHARLSLLVDLCGGLLAILSLVWGAVLVLEGSLLVGGLIAGYTLLVGVLPSVGRIIQALLSFQEAAIAASRLRDLLLTPTERWMGGEPVATVQRVELIRGKIEWSDGSRPFEEVSLQLCTGEMVGLVGTNGSGKSTLTRILTRSIDLTGGCLLVNRSPADAASLEDYRSRVVLLPNEVRIVSGTLADNVLFGRSVAGVEVLEWLVDRIGLGEFMTRFRDRWATRVGEGGRRISSGERQIIGLMRALLFPPDLLLVDEGIGSTDEGHTALVLEALRDFSRERIVLIVSHDPRVLDVVDRLYRFDAGKLEPVSLQGHGDRSESTASPHSHPVPQQRRTYVIS
jgi:ABC-type bacteriocin/lantibiotic exporter with double-glycine peptidase domain